MLRPPFHLLLAPSAYGQSLVIESCRKRYSLCLIEAKLMLRQQVPLLREQSRVIMREVVGETRHQVSSAGTIDLAMLVVKPHSTDRQKVHL